MLLGTRLFLLQSMHIIHLTEQGLIRRLEIIGESVKNLLVTFRTKHSNIPWKQMAGMRDVLTHILTWIFR